MKQHNHVLSKISLKILLTNGRGQYLILKSNPQVGGFGSKYDLPGGRINQGENVKNFTKLIAREIKEELGTVRYRLNPAATAFGLYHFKKSKSRPKDSHTLYILFGAKYLAGRITLSNEHTEHQWLKLTPTVIKKLMHPALHDAINNYFKWNN